VANSRVPGILGRFEHALSRTPGPLGRNDAADPSMASSLGDSPGSLGRNDGADPVILLSWITFMHVINEVDSAAHALASRFTHAASHLEALLAGKLASAKRQLVAAFTRKKRIHPSVAEVAAESASSSPMPPHWQYQQSTGKLTPMWSYKQSTGALNLEQLQVKLHREKGKLVFGPTLTWPQIGYSGGDGTKASDKDKEIWPLVGYYGGDGKNNPTLQNVPGVGPIPKGFYTIDSLTIPKGTHGPNYLTLTPIQGTAAFYDRNGKLYSRSGFLCHGDNVENPGAASTGCIIMQVMVRLLMWYSTVRKLHVIP